MKKGSKKCKICGKFTPEPKGVIVHNRMVYFCHVCYVFLLSSLFNLNEDMIRKTLEKGKKE